jgi:hypothetical protein
MASALKGSCLCGSVTYESTATPLFFQYCACESCRKVTGSAHASNLFVPKESFRWVSGEALVQQYIDETRNLGFTTSFCRQCGCFLPHIGRTGRDMCIPAGTLDVEPQVKPRGIIYCKELPKWYVPTSELKQYDALPPRN